MNSELTSLSIRLNREGWRLLSSERQRNMNHKAEVWARCKIRGGGSLASEYSPSDYLRIENAEGNVLIAVYLLKMRKVMF